MDVDARSIETSTSIMAVLVKCSRAEIIVYTEWIFEQKSGSQRQACGCQRLLNARSERRIAKAIQSNIRTSVNQTTWNFNQGVTDNTFLTKLFTVHAYVSRRPVRKHLQSSLNKSIRLQFINPVIPCTYQCEYEENRTKAWIPHALLHLFKLMKPILRFGGYFWRCLGHLNCVEECLNAPVPLSVFTDQVHSVMLIVYTGRDG
ncbi:hypothetical protein TNCV_2903751 [Trichonephila clavipes]|nr:hypothetical protein TNCV_2903751 [Trichonephila clavipes]